MTQTTDRNPAARPAAALALLEQLAAGERADYLDWLADYLCAHLGSEASLVAGFAGKDPGASVVAASGEGAQALARLAEALCEQTPGGAESLGAEHAAVRLDGAGGRPAGLLAVAGRLDAVRGEEALRVLRRFAPRAARELEARQAPGMVLPRPVAHELNNLLGIVIGNADLALNDLRGDDLVRDCLEEIGAAGRKASGLTQPKRAPVPSAAAAHLPAAGRGILLVEDEAGVRRVASGLLEHAGFTVFCAPTFAEASACLAAHRDEIDLVALDWNLPDATGAEAVARLEGIAANVRILVVTGLCEAELAAPPPPCVGIVRKPFALDAFLPAVLSALGDPARLR